MPNTDVDPLDPVLSALELLGDDEGTEAQLDFSVELVQLAFEMLTPEQQQKFLKQPGIIRLIKTYPPNEEA